MRNFLGRNIGFRGRLLRGLSGAALIVGAVFAYRVSAWLGWASGLSGLFMLFEAGRGWCVLRACGLKTRL